MRSRKEVEKELINNISSAIKELESITQLRVSAINVNFVDVSTRLDVDKVTILGGVNIQYSS